jgi:hypothetical protein
MRLAGKIVERDALALESLPRAFHAISQASLRCLFPYVFFVGCESERSSWGTAPWSNSLALGSSVRDWFLATRLRTQKKALIVVRKTLAWRGLRKMRAQRSVGLGIGAAR